MKRSISFVFFALILALASWGAPTKISLYYWDDAQKPGMDAIIQGFQKANPDVTVEATIIPWAQYWSKLQTSLPSGNGPDVFWINAANANQYIDKGLIYDIQKLIDRDKPDLSKLANVSKRLYTFDGHLYGIPKDFDNIGLFYNKALFDAAGVAYPTANWTWNDFQQAAVKLTKGDQWGTFVGDSAFNGITTCFIYQNGGQIYDDSRTSSMVGSPQAIEAVQFLYDLMYKYKAAPAGAERGELNQNSLFSSGKLAMSIAGNWNLPTYVPALGDKVGVAPLPSKKQKATIVHSLAWVIPAKSPNVEAAWKFLKFCATRPAGEAQAGVVIPAYAGSEKAWLAKYPKQDLTVFTKAMSYGVPYPVAAKNAQTSEQAFLKELENIWLQQKTVSQGLADAQNAMNDAIKGE